MALSPQSRRSPSELTLILFANAANGSNEPFLSIAALRKFDLGGG
jgi:hypothetical protein